MPQFHPRARALTRRLEREQAKKCEGKKMDGAVERWVAKNGKQKKI
jgi:hypothetical protein